MASSQTIVGWINNSLNSVSWINKFHGVVQWTSSQPSNNPLLWQQTLLSQYVASPTLTGMIESFSEAISPNADIYNFYNNIWNVATAVGNGLDIWGQIVGVSRYLTINSSSNFGYDEAYTTITAPIGPQPFNQAAFFNGTSATSNFALSDAQYRRLILVKAAANISNLSVPSINALLRAEFGTSDGTNPYGKAYVIDTGGLTFQYHLEFTPSPVQVAIINNSGVFPKPAGVSVTLTY
jgi:hypothetical protein